MEQFREGHINILVATDLAARGIDVKEISCGQLPSA
jgi:ATP-dependent RNA helicase DeaD